MTTSTAAPETGTQPAPPSIAGRWAAVAAVLGISAWPFLTLLAANADQPLDLGTVARWWVLTTAAGLLVVAATARLRPRALPRVATVWVALVWLVYSFRTLSGLGDGVGWEGDPRVWWAIVAGATVVVIGFLARTVVVQRFVTIAAVALAVATAGQLALVSLSTPPASAAEPAPPATAGFVHRPNVWFIALDGLASGGFMLERTGYDSSAFEATLTEHGFDIQENATANYPFTNLSIGSTLMMSYGYEGVDEPNAAPFFQQIQGDNAVVDLMRANGYAYAHTYPGFWSGSKCVGHEDLCVGADGSLSDTETALASMVPFGEALTTRSKHVDIAISNDPAHVVEQVIDAGLRDPSFNFVHVLNPHAPLLRDADCGVREDIELRFSAWGDGPEYAAAVTCLHRQLETAVDRILEVDGDALIVIQSDHGPRLGIDWTQPDGVFLDDDMYFSILSAIRLPSMCDQLEIPDDLTPVNTFRIVRACLEGATPDLLPDRRFPIRAERDTD